jgi:hypothetical protein
MPLHHLPGCYPLHPHQNPIWSAMARSNLRKNHIQIVICCITKLSVFGSCPEFPDNRIFLQIRMSDPLPTYL